MNDKSNAAEHQRAYLALPRTPSQWLAEAQRFLDNGRSDLAAAALNEAAAQFESQALFAKRQAQHARNLSDRFANVYTASWQRRPRHDAVLHWTIPIFGGIVVILLAGSPLHYIAVYATLRGLYATRQLLRSPQQ